MDDIDFKDFWQMYPRKEGKKKAEVKWNYMRREHKHQAMADIKYRYEGTEKQFIPHCSTYLNQQRWADEAIPKPGTGSKVPSHRVYVEPEREKSKPEVAEKYLDQLKQSLRGKL